MRYLIIGYGNTLCGDDGLGPIVARRLENLLSPQQRQKIDIITLHQLDLVLSNQLGNYSAVIFIDAQIDLYAEDVVIEAINPIPNYQSKVSNPALSNNVAGFSAHFLSPQALLQLTEELYQIRPQAWIVAVRGYQTEMGEGLSPAGRSNAQKAVQAVQNLLNRLLPPA